MPRKFPGKALENTAIVEFPKTEPFRQPKIPEIPEWKSNKKENFQEKLFEKFGYTSRSWPLFRNLCKLPIFFSAIASSFARDHSELEISCKDDAHSRKETL